MNIICLKIQRWPRHSHKQIPESYAETALEILQERREEALIEEQGLDQNGAIVLCENLAQNNHLINSPVTSA